MNKFVSYKDTLSALDLNIKCENEITYELPNLGEEHLNETDFTNNSKRHQEQTCRNCSEAVNLVDPCCGVFVKVEGELQEIKTESCEEGIRDDGIKIEDAFEKIIEHVYEEINSGVHKENTEQNDYKNNFMDMKEQDESFEITSPLSLNFSMFGNIKHESFNIRKGGGPFEVARSLQGRKVKKRSRRSLCKYQTHFEDHLKTSRQIQSNTKLFTCSECSYECNQKSRLSEHLLTHSTTKLFKCSECSYECNRKHDFHIHLLSHSETKLFKCSDCDYGSNHKGSYKRHLLTHSTMKLFKCPECDYECNRNSNLKIHLLSHSDTKLFKCSECDYGSNHKGSLKTHLLTHSSTKCFKCSQCDYECNHKGRLKVHLLIHLKPSPSSVCENLKLPNGGVRKKTNEKEIDRIEASCSQNGNKSTKRSCSKFPKNRRGKYKKRILTQPKTEVFKCSECRYECNQKGRLNEHLLTHSKTKLFKCSQCNYQCNRKSDLKIHLLAHSRTQLFKCSECQYGSNHKGSFKRHLLTHSNIKLFKCSECDYGCNRKCTFNIHLLTHSKPKL